jgi:hypothetical protein
VQNWRCLAQRVNLNWCWSKDLKVSTKLVSPIFYIPFPKRMIWGLWNKFSYFMLKIFFRDNNKVFNFHKLVLNFFLQGRSRLHLNWDCIDWWSLISTGCKQILVKLSANVLVYPTEHIDVYKCKRFQVDRDKPSIGI